MLGRRGFRFVVLLTGITCGLGCGGEVEVAPPTAGYAAIDNSLSLNSAVANGLLGNGVTINGQKFNGFSLNGQKFNGVWYLDAFTVNELGDEESRKFMSYLCSCALPADQTMELNIAGVTWSCP